MVRRRHALGFVVLVLAAIGLEVTIDFRRREQEDLVGRGRGDAIDAAPSKSLIYCDPPYIGLTSTYFDTWDEEKEKGLHDSLMESGCRFMVSSWSHNDYRSNELIGSLWSDCRVSYADHAYIVNGKHRPVVEVLLTNYEAE